MGVLFGTLPGHRRCGRSARAGVVFRYPLEDPLGPFWHVKTCNCSQVYCEFAPELGPQTTSISGHLLGALGGVRDVILDVISDVILDVIWIHFGCHFGDPGGDPAGAARGTSGRVVEITSSETWSFAQAGWPVGGGPSQMQKIGVRKTQKNKVLLAIGLDLELRGLRCFM